MNVNDNRDFLLACKKIIEETKKKFSAKVYKNTHVASNQLMNRDGLIINNRTNIQT